MEKQDYSQLELFSQTPHSPPSRQNLPGSFRSYIRTYEKVLLLTIGMLILATVAYSLGMERGKRSLSGAPAQRAE